MVFSVEPKLAGWVEAPAATVRSPRPLAMRSTSTTTRRSQAMLLAGRDAWVATVASAVTVDDEVGGRFSMGNAYAMPMR